MIKASQPPTATNNREPQPSRLCDQGSPLNLLNGVRMGEIETPPINPKAFAFAFLAVIPEGDLLFQFFLPQKLNPPPKTEGPAFSQAIAQSAPPLCRSPGG